MLDGYEFVGWTEGTVTFPQLLVKIPTGSTGNKTYTAYFKNYDDSPTRPVEYLYLNDAKNFCASLTEYFESSLPAGYTKFDLPTEAQWEYACRAGISSALNNGTNLTSDTDECSNLDLVAWYNKNSTNRTHSVGLKQPNAWGLYDMHGNVNEFCLDFRNQNWKIDYPPGPVTDPINTTEVDEVIIRGGNFSSDAKRNRSASRDGKTPGTRLNNLGFRVVLIQAP